MHIAILCISAVAICTERVEAKFQCLPVCGKNIALQSARSVWRQSRSRAARKRWRKLQSARSVWRQSLLPDGFLRPRVVAICTERVEAKKPQIVMVISAICCNLHGACGGKVYRPPQYHMLTHVAICTERVEAKKATFQGDPEQEVAICTERVEAKLSISPIGSSTGRCNLHGACGGKGRSCSDRSEYRSCNLHGACGGKVNSLYGMCATDPLQSARSVWRQSCFIDIAKLSCVVAICTERVEAKTR